MEPTKTEDFQIGRRDLPAWLNEHLQQGWEPTGQPAPVVIDGQAFHRYTFQYVGGLVRQPFRNESIDAPDGRTCTVCGQPLKVSAALFTVAGRSGPAVRYSGGAVTCSHGHPQIA